MNPRILVVGSSNTDLVVRVPRFQAPGETVLGGPFTIVPGGKGANQAVSAARAGGAVTFISKIGNDPFGAKALAGFRQDGINATHVRRATAAASGVALILVTQTGENSIAVAPGANACLSPVDILAARAAFARAQILLLQLETPLSVAMDAARRARKYRIPVILNPSPAQRLPGALLRLVTWLTPNETEAELLTGCRIRNWSDAARAAKILRQAGAANVMVTLGARGVLVASSSEMFRVPAFRVRPVDTTAAGDVFHGALAVCLAAGRPILEAARFACAAAAISVTRPGAQPSAPRRAEIERFLRRNKPRE